MVVLNVAVYFLLVSIVMGGGAVYFWLAAAVGVVGEAGQPALTATSLAWAWSFASAPFAAAVVLVVLEVDFEDELLLPPETRKTIPTMIPAMTTMITVLRICLRRFCCLASSASRASLAAR